MGNGISAQSNLFCDGHPIAVDGGFNPFNHVLCLKRIDAIHV